MRPEDTRRLIFSVLNETQQEVFERKKELDFSLAVTGNLRFRANIYYQKGAVSAAFRLIPTTIPSLDQLGLPPELTTLAMRNNGLLLVTGPTGSGKSTTLAALIDIINGNKRCHIVTVEDPIEYLHVSKHAVIDQREVYADTLSFGNALKYVLRQDPDVILISMDKKLKELFEANLIAWEQLEHRISNPACLKTINHRIDPAACAPPVGHRH